MAVTALTLLVAQLINLTLLVVSQRNERVIAVAAGAAVQLGDVADRVASGQPLPQRMIVEARDLGEDGSGQHVVRRARFRRTWVSDQPLIPPGMTPWPEVADQVARALSDEAAISDVRAGRRRTSDHDELRQLRLPAGTRAIEHIAVAGRLADGRWVTVRARLPVAGQRIGALLLGQTLVLFALLLGPLLFVAWRVTRPLSRLVSAAGDMRPGLLQEPVPETGPSDVRDLTRAFNDMRRRIMAMLLDKDRMLGAIGHDLRTPLASLRVRVEQIDDGLLQEKMIATIDEMTAMLNDILSLARAGQPHEQPQLTDLAAMLADIVDDYRMLDKPAELAAQGVIDSAVVRPVALARAVRNLIDNAIAYGGRAVVGLERQASGQTAIVIEDDGPGIAADRIADMLEPFARAEESRNRNTGGTGLGLALARAVVLAEGGELILANRQPKGLSATILLPLQT